MFVVHQADPGVCSTARQQVKGQKVKSTFAARLESACTMLATPPSNPKFLRKPPAELPPLAAHPDESLAPGVTPQVAQTLAPDYNAICRRITCPYQPVSQTRPDQTRPNQQTASPSTQERRAPLLLPLRSSIWDTSSLAIRPSLFTFLPVRRPLSGPLSPPTVGVRVDLVPGLCHVSHHKSWCTHQDVP